MRDGCTETADMNMKSHKTCDNGLTPYLAGVRKLGNRRSSEWLRTFSTSHGTDEAVLTSTHISMFLSRNKKNNVYPCKPQFYCIKVGFKGVKII